MGIRISEMEEATTFGADDYVPIVTNGTNKKALGQKIKDFIAGFFATKNGDNITDDSAFRTAIGINAANTPFVNTGTGMTAEDVQAGIEELNTSKANIDGSNIANPSAFRQNIDVKSIVVENKIKTTEIPTIAANSVSSININVSKTGYTPSGIMGITGTGTSGLVIQEYYLTGTTATVYFRNVTSSSINPSLIRLTILYIKA